MAKSIGQEIIEGLRQLDQVLSEKRPLSESFTCSRVVLDLRPSDYDARKVRGTRKLLGMSQALFAQFLGVSAQTVRAWEQEKNAPNDIARRFMDEIRLDPDHWRARLSRSISARETAHGKQRAKSERKRRTARA